MKLRDLNHVVCIYLFCIDKECGSTVGKWWEYQILTATIV